MAEYKTIKGFKTQSYATDPVAATAAWSSGGVMNSSRGSLGCAGRTVATSLGIGGNPGAGAVDLVEEYNGTARTELADINTARQFNRGTGTSTAALTTGEGPPVSALNELWNGTSWTEAADLNTARGQGGEVGSSTAALYFAGAAPSTVYDSCETYNGTSWAETADLNTARRYANAAGITNTAALCAGGNTSNPGSASTANSETWNGTSWSEGSNINNARFNSGSGGPSTSAMIFGGSNPPGPSSANTETYDGTSWAETADLAVADSDLGGTAASTTSALTIGGGNPPIAAKASEEFNDYSVTNPAPSLTMLNEGQIWYNTTGNALKYTALAGAWSSAANLNTGRNAVGGSRGGTQTATMIFGGEGATAQTGLTEEFDGSTWTEKADLNTARRAGGGFGTTTAALFSGGVTNTTHTISTDAVEEWNGSSWTETTSMGTPRYSGFNAGATETAGIIASGISRPGAPPGSPISYRLQTETWNGSAWTETGDMLVGRYDGGGVGTTTSMLAVGGSGFPPAPGAHASVESFNGTSWTEGNNLNTARPKATGAGDNTSALMAGGGNLAVTESWNGTSWSEVADLATARSANDSGAGTTTATIIASGTAPPSGQLTATEEFNFANTVKTVTVS